MENGIRVWEHSAVKHCRRFLFMLALFWIIGLLCGASAAKTAGASFRSCLRAAASGRLSFPALAVAVSFPLVLSFLLCLIDLPWLLLPISLFEAFSLTFCLCGAALAFGSAGWLAGRLLLFTAGWMPGILWWFWLRRLSGGPDSAIPDFCLSFVAVFLIGSFDFRVVSPFLAKLLGA